MMLRGDPAVSPNITLLIRDPDHGHSRIVMWHSGFHSSLNYGTAVVEGASLPPDT